MGAFNSGAKGNSRDFGLTGPGKGDSDRTRNRAAFNQNLEQVALPRVPASQDATFKRRGNRFVKKY